MKKDWFSVFNNMLSESAKLGPVMILGDLNANLLEPHAYPANELLHNLAIASLHVPEILPTRITEHSSTCLDIIAVDKFLNCTNYSVSDIAASDHFPVTASITTTDHLVLKPVKKRSYKNLDIIDFNNRVAKINLRDKPEFNSITDVNEVLEYWYKEFNAILDSVAPIQKFPYKKNYLPWISRETKQIMAERDKVARNLLSAKKRNLPITSLIQDLKLLRKRTKSLIKHDTQNYGQDILSMKDHSAAWKFIRRITFSAQKGSESNIDPNLLNDFFANTVKSSDHADCISPFLVEKINVFHIEPLTITQVEKALSLTDVKAAAGQDGIPGHILKRAAVAIAPDICHIFNLSIKQSIFPLEWKKSNVRAIWKNKGSKSLPGNYRPISIIPILARILEKQLAYQLSTYCYNHEIIPQQQFGFRKKSNCELALLTATDNWLKQIDQNKVVGALLIDLSKAFDTVPHQKLILELSMIDCSLSTLKLFASYLNDRSQRIIHQDITTEWRPVQRGVPQGSGLSPLLFNIYTRQLPSTNSSDTVQFADDITHSEAAEDTGILLEQLKSTFNDTLNFCVEKELIINTEKTQFIIFKSSSKRIPPDLALNLNNHTIKAQHSVKLLGVTLDRHLTFKDHINATITRCHGLLGVLRRAVPLLPLNLAKLYYTSIVRSQLEYACGVFSSAAKTHLEKLDVIQRIAARIILQVPNDSHAKPLLEILKLQSLESRRENHLLALIDKILDSSCHPALIDTFRYSNLQVGELQIPQSRTQVGRKRFSHFGAILYNQTRASN